MSSPYDAGLLASAPKATKAQLQDGYDADLLVEKTSSTPTSAVDPEIVNHHRSPIAQRETAFPLANKLPFYRTKRGILIIVVLVIVVIVAVVGGAVGGSLGNKSNKKLSAAASSVLHNATSTSAAANTNTQEAGSGASTVLSKIFGSPTPTP